MVPSWQELCSNSLKPNIFYSPEFHIPALRHLADHSVETVVVFHEGEVHGVIPMVEVRSAAGTVQKKLWRHEQCFLDLPLLHRETASESVHELLHHFGGEVSLQMDHAVDAPEVHEAFEAGLREPGSKLFVRDQYERLGFLRFPDEESYFRALSKHRRKDYRAKKRRIEKRFGKIDHRVFSKGDELHVSIENFLELESKGWKGEEGTALLCSKHEAAFFREMCVRASESGSLRFHALMVGEAPIAMCCDLFSSPVGFAYKSAYDEDFADYSPGFLLSISRFLHIVNECPEIQLLDSCMAPGENQRKGIWLGGCRVANYTLSKNPWLNGVLGTRRFVRQVASALRP